MKTAAEIQMELQATSSRLAKEAILREAWAGGHREFFAGAQLAYDPLVTFGVKAVPTSSSTKSNFDWPAFEKLTTDLRNRKITGHAARDAIQQAANNYNQVSWNQFYRLVLLKDLKCGTTDTTINKVLAEFGKPSEDYLIPVFACQLAKNAEDHPNHMMGPKLVDWKLDGIRLLTVINVETREVTQFTRNGKINDRFRDIRTSLESMIDCFDVSVVLDGEVTSKNFQTLMTQVNRKENVDTSDAKLALFDIVPLAEFQTGESGLNQTDRQKELVKLTSAFQTHCQDRVYVLPKKLVDLSTAQGQTEFKEFNRTALELGLEGIMIKNPNATYECRRSFNWLKIKPFITVDLTIVAVEPGTPGSKFEHTLGNIVCEGIDQGKFIRVSVGSGFSDDLREEIWNNQSSVIGRIAEIKGDALTLNRNSVDEYSLRFPTFMQFRNLTPDSEKI